MAVQSTAALHVETRSVASLGDSERGRMYALMAAHYNAVTRPQFDTDLAWKHAVCLLRDGDGCIQGFSTLVLNPRGSGRPDSLILYSGDTIVDHAHWGSQALVRGFCETAGRVHATWPRKRLLWYLLSKGHRTYLYLPLFSTRYYPAAEPGRHDADLRDLADDTSRRLFGDCYQADTGLVVFPTRVGELKPQLADDSWGRREHPQVAYFLRRNPRFAMGDELVCMTELSVANMRRTARRYFEHGMANPFCAEEREWWTP